MAQKVSALHVAGFDRHLVYSRKDLDRAFVKRNRYILSHTRGAGYWLWKPYIIHKTLATLDPDDVLVYADAGILFLRPVDAYIRFMHAARHDLMSFYMRFKEKNYTKRDAFILMGCDTPDCTGGWQRGGGFHFWRKTDFTMQFAAEWLHYAQDPRIITDLNNQCGEPNYPSFKENRHDQSIFSLLTKQYRVAAYPRWATACNHRMGKFEVQNLCARYSYRQDTPRPSPDECEHRPLDGHSYPLAYVHRSFSRKSTLPLSLLKRYNAVPSPYSLFGVTWFCQHFLIYCYLRCATLFWYLQSRHFRRSA